MGAGKTGSLFNNYVCDGRLVTQIKKKPCSGEQGWNPALAEVNGCVHPRSGHFSWHCHRILLNLKTTWICQMLPVKMKVWTSRCYFWVLPAILDDRPFPHDSQFLFQDVACAMRQAQVPLPFGEQLVWFPAWQIFGSPWLTKNARHFFLPVY